MLGQPVSMLIPKVVGFKLTGELPAGATATDLVPHRHRAAAQAGRRRQVRRVLRPRRLQRAAGRPRHDRQHEPGVRLDLRDLPDRRRDAVLPAAHRPPGRDGRARRGLRQGAGHVARPVGRAALLRARRARPVDDRAVAGRPEAPAGPRAADRRQGDVPHRAGRLRHDHPVEQDRKPGVPPAATAAVRNGLDEASAESFPASDPIAPGTQTPADEPAPHNGTGDAVHDRPSQPGARRRSPAATRSTLDHGHVAIAAITSLHQHLEPLRHGRRRPARQERRREGPDQQAVGQDDPRARLQGRHRLLREGGARPPTSTSSASRPSATAARPASATAARCPTEVSAAVNEGDLAVVSVLSGNRNFEGRINPDIKMNYLASPPLVVAYALAGSMDVDITTEPLGTGTDGEPVYLRDIWPSPQDVAAVVGEAITSDMYASSYSDVFAGTDRWQAIEVPAGETFSLGPRVDLRPQAPVLRRHGARAQAAHRHHRREGAGQARRLGHDRPHQPRRQHQAATPPPGSTCRSTASSPRTSTATAPAAATTRS